jgi:hypothetical protein
MSATQITMQEPRLIPPESSKRSASESVNYKSSPSAESHEKSVQSLELSPFPGTTLKISGFPLWANLSIIGLAILAIIGILLIPRLRNLLGFGNRQEKRLLPGLSILTILGFLLGFFLSQSLSLYPSSKTVKFKSSNARFNQPATRGKKTPSPPYALYAQSSSKDSGIQLQWKDKSTSEDGFRVERIPKDGNSTNFTVIAVLGENADKYLDTAIDPGAVYEYRVASFNIYGSAYSPSAGSIANDEGKSTAAAMPLWPLIGSTLVASIVASGASFAVVKWFFKRIPRVSRRDIEESVYGLLHSPRYLEKISYMLDRPKRYDRDF